jgi:polysaccharide transporter, PST family
MKNVTAKSGPPDAASVCAPARYPSMAIASDLPVTSRSITLLQGVRKADQIKLVTTLVIIFVGLAGRSGVDKVLTLRGGPELVAFWAQLGSIIEVVAGVALAGVGTGISVLVAQAGRPERQRELLHEALKLGLAVSALAMLAVIAVSFALPGKLSGHGPPQSLVAFAAAVGCVAVIPGMLNGYWLGQQRRGLMLALATASALALLAAALAAPRDRVLAALALAQAAPALAAVFVLFKPGPRGAATADRDSLRRYVLPGLAIGVLTPLATVAVRDIVSAQLSWSDVGRLQALWRVSDWVASVAAGVMAVHFLPRLAAANGTPRFSAELRLAALATILPSALALVALGVLRRPVFTLLYDESFLMSDAAVVLFLAGTFVRIASWLPLYALYAMRRTGPLVVGEFLSMPMFAGLLALYPWPLALESAGALWLAAYAAYGLFNLWAVRRAS